MYICIIYITYNHTNIDIDMAVCNRCTCLNGRALGTRWPGSMVQAVSGSLQVVVASSVRSNKDALK